ncbi:MAG: hypothetical protein GXO81_05565 [Chlorobi bacterium]|nr:hypothetical protein [Chlorobiota bacterium]
MKADKIKLQAFFLTVAIFGTIIFSLLRISNTRNNIDILEDTLEGVKTIVPDTSEVYLFSNYRVPLSKNKIYFYTQFALAPRIIIKEDNQNAEESFNKVPNNGLILLIEDKISDSTFFPNIESSNEYKILYVKNNDMYGIKLLSKKPSSPVSLFSKTEE